MQLPSTMEKQGSITASIQQGSDLGDGFQTKVNDQMKVMAAVKSRLAEEEDEIDCQRRAMELDIHTRYATGLRLLGECRDACLASLREAAGHLTDRLQAEKLSAHLVMRSLKDYTDVSSTSRSLGSSSNVQSALLSEAALRHFRQVASAREEKLPVFSHTRSDSTAALMGSLRHFMGTVAPSRERTVSGWSAVGNEVSNAEHVQLLTDATDPELERLRHDLDALLIQTRLLQRDNHQVRTDLRIWKEGVVTDVAGLKRDMGRLQEDISKAANKAENSHKGAEATVTAHTENRLRDLEAVSPDGRHFQRDMATDIGDATSPRQCDTCNLHTEMTSVQADPARSQQSQRQTETTLTELKAQMAKLNTQVFFNAQLSKDRLVARDETLVLDKVLTNAGGGYDVTTGVFTAPLTATYLFMATSRADWDSECIKSSQKRAGFKVLLEGQEIGSSFSMGPTSCTTHVVVRLDAGQRVWVKSNFANSSFRGYGYTSFSGVLIQPEL